jgi:Spy/CpxP family protein refolding chaperone
MTNTAMMISMPWAVCTNRIVTAVLVGALATVACGGGAANVRSVATGSAADDDATAGLKEYHRYHHHGGVTLFLAMSLDTLAVSPEQHAAVEKIRVELLSQMEPSRVAEQTLVTTLAEGLATGNLEAAKVDAAMMQVKVAAAAVHDASASALNELHGLLTPPQRAALVDKVSSHWAVWQQANDAESRAGGNDDGHLATLAVDLDLTTDQVDKIRAGLGERLKGVPRLDPQEITTHLQAFGDAFRAETFDAKKLMTANDANAHVAGWGAAHLASFVETAVLVLTPDQRAQLAQHLREHAAHGPVAQGSP